MATNEAADTSMDIYNYWITDANTILIHAFPTFPLKYFNLLIKKGGGEKRENITIESILL